jgi:hypothetical protein
MKKKKEDFNIRESINLFITGFVQVFFVAINTYFLSKIFYLGVFLCAFMISFIWSWNVKKVAFGTISDRIVYASGAAFGSIVGLLISTLILK